MVPADRAVDPNQMYLAAYEYVFPHYGWAVAATALFVVISQLKINVTNAYAGSLAWSNFFSRVTHSHPGRVVWVVFNTLIAFMLMEMNVFQALGDVLGLYSNIAIAWMMAVVADLVVNKPLGLSPRGIEFKRAYLYDINPVGVGAMALASTLSIAAYLGVFGPMAQAFSALIAMGVAFVAAPLIAWGTKGRYYIARRRRRLPTPTRCKRCVICEREYEGPDMAHCPAYQGPICSLCCTLDARCGDLCKPHASLSAQWSAPAAGAAAAARLALPRHRPRPLPAADAGDRAAARRAVRLLYHQELQRARRMAPEPRWRCKALRATFVKAYFALLLVAGIVAWWLVLAHKSRQVAQEESNRQTHLLMREIDSHRQTDEALQQAKQAADRRARGRQANQAKSRYISAISHELRTPLNSILGYAQLMGEDAGHPAAPQARRQRHQARRRAPAVADRGHAGHRPHRVRQAHAERQADALRRLRARDGRPVRAAGRGKGLAFRFETEGSLPEVVRADEKRVRQILINLLGNAIKFTARARWCSACGMRARWP
jgi:signal transduction histidine kinase